MVKPLWALTGIALLGTAGVVGALVVASPGGEEEVVQQVETATPTTTEMPATLTPSHAPPTAVNITPSSTPTAETTSYVDRISGFSFQYPADWFIGAPPDDPDIVGYGVTLYSYNPQKARPIGVAPGPDKLKIDIGVEPNPDGLTVQEWIAQRLAGPDEGVVTTAEEPSSVDGEPAVKRAVSIQETKVIQHLFGHQGKMYFITAYTADSVLIGELDSILTSFKLPR